MSMFIHPIAQAQFLGTAVGTVVRDEIALLGLIWEAVRGTVFPENGQGFLLLPADATAAVTAGVAPRLGKKADDYRVREHRGEMVAVLRRDRIGAVALDPDGVAAIVYTAAGFLADPETTPQEAAAFVAAGHEYCLITVLGFGGPKAPLTSHRFVRNLSGRNAAYADKSAEALRAEATAIVAYEEEWCVVG